MDIHLFKDIKRLDDSHYWFSDKLDNDTRLTNSASSFEDALITIGKAIGINNIKVDKILYDGKQINKDDWNK
jgi:hypothetical protein